MNDRARARAILRANEHMVISTADELGRPWITPASYSFDEHHCLYWVSSKDSRHSINIKARKEVAIVIYMLEPMRDALYIEAEAQELIDKAEIEGAIKVLNGRLQPEKFRVKSVRDVSGRAAWRVYKAVPKAMFVREQTTVNSQAVTVRRETLP